jgi:serine/threonine-protein kinase
LYSASQLPIGREVCLKVMPGVGIQGTARRRFLREASVMAKMQHPNTVHVHDYGITEEGMGFLAMEKLEGRTLQQIIHLEGRLDPLRTLRLFRQLASGVAAAHANDIIHRDLCPGNVTIAKVAGEEVAKISDFGLIKPMIDHEAITGGQRILGNPAYMSPEQARGEEIDGRADVYSLGVMLFEALTGQLPFQGRSQVALIRAHLMELAPRLADSAPDVAFPACLEWLVATCLEKERDARFGSTQEVLRALRVAGEVVHGRRHEDTSMHLQDGHVVLAEADMPDQDTTGSVVTTQGELLARGPNRTILGGRTPLWWAGVMAAMVAFVPVLLGAGVLMGALFGEASVIGDPVPTEATVQLRD